MSQDSDVAIKLHQLMQSISSETTGRMSPNVQVEMRRKIEIRPSFLEACERRISLLSEGDRMILARIIDQLIDI